MSENTLIFIAIGIAIIGLIYGFGLIGWVKRQPDGDPAMREVASAIQAGAKAYLRRQYSTIAIVAAVLFIILWLALGFKISLGFLVGAVFSGLAGYIGMMISVQANVRVAQAAKKGLGPALQLAFRGGTITGMMVVGLGLLAIAGFYGIFKDINALIGLGFLNQRHNKAGT